MHAQTQTMRFIRSARVSLVLSLLWSALVRGQCTGTTTISTSTQATAVAECGTYNGNILVSGAQGDFSLSTLTSITGNLYVTSNNNALTSLTADNLETIGDQMQVLSLRNLTTIHFPVLRNIDSLYISGLPNLREIDAGDQGITNVSTITVQRTGLENMDWLRSSTVQSLSIQENLNLTQVNLPGLGLISRSLTVTENRPGLPISLPDLEMAYNVSISSCVELDLPLLTRVNSSFSIRHSPLEILSLPELRSVGNDFMLWNNSALSTTQVPALVNVSGDIVVSSNPDLITLQFPDLANVRGDISANGTFTQFNMPSLQDVQGNVVIRSSRNLNCDEFQTYSQENVLKARYFCESGSQTLADDDANSGNGGDNNTTNAPRSSGRSRTFTIVGIVVGVVIGLLLLGSAIFCFWSRKTRNSRNKHSFNDTAKKGDGKEMYRSPNDAGPKGPSRLTEEYFKPELEGGHGVSNRGNEGTTAAAAELSGESNRYERRNRTGVGADVDEITRVAEMGSDTTPSPRYELEGSAPQGSAPRWS